MDIINYVASTGAEKAKEGVNKIGGEGATGLDEGIKTIINAVIGVVGAVAVIMIIVGGINYATSQGDATKVKKGKDTILYGIIGLVIVIMAYAIVNFVLAALIGS